MNRAIVGLALSFIPADRQAAFRERLAMLNETQDFSGIAEDVEAALARVRGVEGDPRAVRPVGEMPGEDELLRLQVEASLLSALAAEHVAERLDKLIELAFDEGRSIHVRSA